MFKNIGSYLIIILLLAVSCLEGPECFQLRNDRVGVTFKVMGTGAQYSQRFGSIGTDGTDSVFLQNFNRANFIMPINMFEGQTSLNFANYNNSGTDRMLILGYKVQHQYVSPDCGPRMTATDLHVIDHNFDSVRIVNTIPGVNNQARNIEIFRCPNPTSTRFAFYQLYYPGRASEELTRQVDKITTNFNSGTYARDQNVKVVTVPVNLTDPGATYTFFLGNDTLDLTLAYHIASETRYRPCGTQTFVDSLRVASHQFDSARINTDADGRALRSITDPPQTNVVLYRCPDTHLVQIAFRKPNEAGTGTISGPVSLVGIKTDYSNEVFYANTQNVTTVQLPLNGKANETTFYIQYDEIQTDTVTFSYTRTHKQIFTRVCHQDVFYDLVESSNLQKVTVTADSLVFPPITNIEILNP